jgi:hypothetical protein
VLAARASRARHGGAGRALLFDEIYGGTAPALPASVADALLALSRARQPRRTVQREPGPRA